MTEYAESLLECDLQEVLGDKPAPDLRDRAIARLREQDRPAPRLPEQAAAPRGRRPGWRWIAQAAGIALVLGLIGWLVTRPESGTATYLAAPGAKIVAINDRLELSEGAVVLRTGAPELLILDHRGNTRVESMQGLALAGTHYRDGMELPDEAGLKNLGLTEEERTMWPKAARNIVTTGALTLIVFSGSAVVDGLKVEAGKPKPAGLRPPVNWESDAQPEPRPEDQFVIDDDNRQRHEKIDTPKADDIPGIKALIGKATRAELRVMDEDYRWRGWLQAKSVNDVETIRAAFADNLKAKAVKVAGYDHLNTFRLELADGRVLRAAVYTYGDLVDVSMPGQVGSTQYEVDPALRKALQPWLDKAAKVDPLPLKDAAAMRELLARAQSVAFRDDFVAEKPLAGTLALRDHVKALTEAFWRDNLAASDAEGGTSRTVFQFTFRLPEDETVAVEITDNGWFAMKIAGAPDLVFRALPAGALQSIHNVLEPHGKAATPAPVSVLRSWSGPNSGVKKARAEILTTEDQWKKTWAEHDPAAELPKIDFEREMVLAIFDGDSWNSRGFYVHELLVGDNAATIIRVDETTYQSMGEGNRVTPFGIFVITRTERPVTVEENVQGIIGKPPQWKPLTARAPMFRDLPTVDKVFTNYRPAQTWTGAATRTEGLFMTATNDTEWRDMWDKMIIADPQLPVIDWTKQMAVAMRGNIMQGLGDFKLEYAGTNANRTVLRLITPTAQTSGGGAESEPRYAIWVIPRPEKSLVVETPRYGRLDQPPSWLEEHVVKLK